MQRSVEKCSEIQRNFVGGIKLKEANIFKNAYGQAGRGDPPPPHSLVSLTIKYRFFDGFPIFKGQVSRELDMDKKKC